MARPKVSVEEKIRKDHPEFVDSIQGLSVQQLEKRLSDLAKGTEEIETAKENDAGLEEAKDTVAELNAPYRDAKKVARLKTRYVISLIKDKGGE